MSEHRFADPTERQRSHCDPELRGGDVSIEIIKQFKQALRTAAAARNQHFDTRAHAYESKFRSDKETVG